MKLIVHGAGGRMGQTLCGLIAETEGFELAAAVSMEFETDPSAGKYRALEDYAGEADCVVDFSNHTAAPALCAWAAANKLPLVIATTGFTAQEQTCIDETAKQIPVFQSANMSLGVALLACLAKIAAKALPGADIELVEAHHNQKLDVPSGTALLLANAVQSVLPDTTTLIGRRENGKRPAGEIGIHSLRMGGEVGTHALYFATGSQVITLKHEAKSRALFAEGALCAAKFLQNKQPGQYNMDDLFV